MLMRNPKSLTDKELIAYLNTTESIDASYLVVIMSEILRRMNEKSPLLTREEQNEWGNPLTP